jgi:hypothetical protein
LVGICGGKQHGKDTVAALLAKMAGADAIRTIRRGMADYVKEEIAECFSQRMSVPKEELLRQMNTTGEKERWRLIMQWWGTEYRRAADKDYWVKRMDSWLQSSECPEHELVIIPDIRFTNEILYIADNGGYLILVDRPGLSEVVDTHVSEQEWRKFDGWNSIIINDGTEEELALKVKALFAQVFDFMTQNASPEVSMPKYNVHVYPVVRIMIPDIQADSMTEAIDKAERMVSFDALFERDNQGGNWTEMSFAEEIAYWLVDMADDPNYNKTTWFIPDTSGKPVPDYDVATNVVELKDVMCMYHTAIKELLLSGKLNDTNTVGRLKAIQKIAERRLDFVTKRM